MKRLVLLSLLFTIVLAKSILPLKQHEQLFNRSIENIAAKKAVVDKIVGGRAARPGEIPWQASMKTLSLEENSWTFRHYCGATIISEYWLLSAAHCFNDAPKWKWRVTVGELSLTAEDQDEQVFEVDSIVNHELYDKEKDYDYDVALIKIKPKLDGRGIKFSKMVSNACIPKFGAVESDADLIVSGWGGLYQQIVDEDQDTPDVLQKAVVPLIDQGKCEQAYPKEITDRMFCAGFFDGTIDSCQGDSGGPLVYKTEGAVVLLGIVSWGDGCSKPGYPNVYARVSKFYHWIEKTTELHSDNMEQSVFECEDL